MFANNRNTKPAIETISLVSDSDEENDNGSKPFNRPPPPSLSQGSKKASSASWRNGDSTANHSGPRVQVSGESLPPKYEWDLETAGWRILSMQLKDQRNRQPAVDHATRSVTECNLDFESHETFEDKRESLYTNTQVLKQEFTKPIPKALTKQPPLTGSIPCSPPPFSDSIKLPKITINIQEDSRNAPSFIPAEPSHCQDMKLDSIGWVPALVQLPCRVKCSFDVTHKDSCELPDSSLSLRVSGSLKNVLLTNSVEDRSDSPWKDLGNLISAEESKIFQGVEQSSFISSTTKSPTENLKNNSEYKFGNDDVEEVCKYTKSEFEESVITHQSSSRTIEVTSGDAANTPSAFTTNACEHLISVKSTDQNEFQIDLSHTDSVVAMNVDCNFTNPDVNISSSTPKESVLLHEPLLSEHAGFFSPVQPEPSKYKKFTRFQADLARHRIIRSLKMNNFLRPLKDSWGSWLRKKLRYNKVKKPAQKRAAIDLRRTLKRRKAQRRTFKHQNDISSHSNQETLSDDTKNNEDSETAVDEIPNQDESADTETSYSLHTNGCGSANYNFYGDGYEMDMPVLVPQVPLVLSSFVCHSPVDALDTMEEASDSSYLPPHENQDCPTAESIASFASNPLVNSLDNMEEGSDSASNLSHANQVRRSTDRVPSFESHSPVCSTREGDSDSTSIITPDRSEDDRSIEQSSSLSESHQEGTEKGADSTNDHINQPSSSSVSSYGSLDNLPRGTNIIRPKAASKGSTDACLSTSAASTIQNEWRGENRIRPHKRLERKIGPRASQILNRFLEENGHTPVPFEVASLSAETNVHKDVIYKWFKKKREKRQNRPSPSSYHHVVSPAVPPMYSTQEMLTITLSDSEEGGDAASKGSSSYAQKSTNDRLAMIKNLDPRRLQCLFEKSVNTLLSIVNIQTEEHASFEQFQQDTGQLLDVLHCYSIFSDSQLEKLDCWLSSVIKDYKQVAGEPDDEQDINDLVATLSPWRVVVMYAQFTEQSLGSAVRDLEKVASNTKYEWRIPAKVDRMMI